MLPLWNDSFSVHNNEIDDQHKKLFELAHRAYNLSYQHASREQIKTILSEFFEYMKIHFQDEEKYMDEIDYPEREDHKLLHKHIVKELAKTIQTIKNVHDMKDKLKTIAHDWLLEHILHDDMLIEKHRLKSALNPEVPRTEEDNKMTSIVDGKVKKVKKYYYSCGCEGRIHTLSEKVHKQIEASSKTYKCKTCKKPIYLNEEFNRECQEEVV